MSAQCRLEQLWNNFELVTALVVYATNGNNDRLAKLPPFFPVYTCPSVSAGRIAAWLYAKSELVLGGLHFHCCPRMATKYS